MKNYPFKCIFLVLFVWVAGFLLNALDPQKQLTQYIHKKWSANDGLPNNNIYSILQTADGYLWIGTDKGLTRFDGVKFELFEKENYPEIKDNRISVIFESRDQTLWIGTRGGLVRYKNGRFKSLVSGSGKDRGGMLLHDVINSIMEDGEGNILVGYQGEGLSIIQNGSLQGVVHPEVYSKIPLINTICRDIYRSDTFWLGTRKGIYIIKQGDLEKFSIRQKNGESISSILTMICTENGDIWLGTDKQGVIHLTLNRELNRWQSRIYNTDSGLKFNYINTLFRDSDNNIWIGTEGGGLYRLAGDEISSFSEEDGLSNDSVNCIYEDREGNLWVGTLSGLNLLMNGKFTTYTETEGLLDNMTWTVFGDRQNRLWITTNEGLNCFYRGKFTAFSRKDGLCSDFVSCTWEDRKDNLWIGTYDRGINLLRDGVFSNIGLDQGIDSLSIRAIYEDSQGNIWVGSYGSGLFIKPPKKKGFYSISTKNGLSSDYIFSIYEARNGAMWIGTDGGGINRILDDHITIYNKKDGLSSNSVFSFIEDTEKVEGGALWLGTEDGGLNYFKNGKAIPITVKEGLSDNTVYQIIDDGNGFFWMGGHKGVSRVMKENLYDFLSGRLSSITTQLFGRADGIKGDECSGSFQPAGWKTIDGNIWFPTSQGIVCVDPEHIKINTLAPPVHIEKIYLDGQPVQWHGSLTLKPDFQKIEIHYTALSLSEPRDVKFKYILEGFDSQWETPRDRKDRIALYMNLSPGDYTFRLTACNNDGIWNKEGISLPLKVLYPFWRKWWFLLLAAVIFSLISYAVLSGIKQLYKMADFWHKKNYIGKYKIIKQIGSGGMANIYKVVSRSGHKKAYMALKLMKEEFIFDDLYRKRFLDEGKIIDSLNHPHIVKVFARGEYNNNPFIAMELLEGQTLDYLIQQKGRIPFQESVDIVRQIIEALRAIHQKGITHRDLKPGNIMIMQKENEKLYAKVLDFGLAKTQALSRVTESGLVVGTLNYLAPEQLLNSEFSPASDIYSLGVILYELLTGQKPYKGETPLEIMQQMFKSEIIDPKKINPEIPGPLNSLIMNMLDQKPENRPTAEVLTITFPKSIHQPALKKLM